MVADFMSHYPRADFEINEENSLPPDDPLFSRWYHIAIVLTDCKSIRIFVNGDSKAKAEIANGLYKIYDLIEFSLQEYFFIVMT